MQLWIQKFRLHKNVSLDLLKKSVMENFIFCAVLEPIIRKSLSPYVELR